MNSLQGEFGSLLGVQLILSLYRESPGHKGKVKKSAIILKICFSDLKEIRNQVILEIKSIQTYEKWL